MTEQRRLYPKPYGDPGNQQEVLGWKPIGKFKEMEDLILNGSHNLDIQTEPRAEGSLLTRSDPIFVCDYMDLEAMDQSNI